MRGASLRALVIFFGANDAARPGDAQYVPLDEYKRNLGRLVAFVRELPGGVQPMLVTPPPVTTFWEGDEETRSTERTAIYAEACVEAGRRLGVPVLNLHDDMVMAEGGKGQFLCDGLHLSAKGNRFMYERLVDMFRGCVPDLCPDLLKPNAPLSKDIDPLDPTKALGESSLV